MEEANRSVRERASHGEIRLPSNVLSLEGRVALVVGASRGIGRAIALSFAGAKATLLIVARNAAGLQKVASEAEGLGASVSILSQDVRTMEGVDETARVALERYGRIDVLVNVAGTNIRKPALAITESDWEEVLSLNLRTVFFMSQAAARIMISKDGGKIINVASLTSVIGIPNLSVYGASKGGVVQLTKALAVEWAPYNIRVNALGPGYIETDLTAPVFQDPERRAWILSRTPMGRHGHPGDLAGAALFLASDASDYVTGQVLYVDGGWLSA